MERLYTLQQVSEITGIRLMDVIGLSRNGDIDTIRAVRESDLIAFQKHVGQEPLKKEDADQALR